VGPHAGSLVADESCSVAAGNAGDVSDLKHLGCKERELKQALAWLLEAKGSSDDRSGRRVEASFALENWCSLHILRFNNCTPDALDVGEKL
jgi:hypothetical protein